MGATPSPGRSGPAVVVARKWVERRAEVDRLTGAVTSDPRTSGASEADDAALEWAVRLAGAWDAALLAVTVGPPGADAVLRPALALGARCIRVAGEPGMASVAVASALAGVARRNGATLVLCGDASPDRGSGSVPAFTAHFLGAAQALGLVDLAADPSCPTRPGMLRAWRRLDGARREELAVSGLAVISVEGATARLRRAPLAGALGAARLAGASEIEVVGDVGADDDATGGMLPAAPVATGPLRPRARVVPPPEPATDARRRVLALTGVLVDRTPPQLLELGPEEAAERILEALGAWGELDPTTRGQG